MKWRPYSEVILFEDYGYGTVDKFGRAWAAHAFVCSLCGQPDSVGNCTHKRMKNTEARLLARDLGVSNG